MSDLLGWFDAPTPRWVAIGLAILVWLLWDEIGAHRSGFSLAGQKIEELRDQIAGLKKALDDQKEQVAGLKDALRSIDDREDASRLDDIEARLLALEAGDLDELEADDLDDDQDR